MKITGIDRATHRMIGERMAKELKNLGDELGLDLSCVGGQYGGQHGVFKIEAVVRETAAGVSGDQELFDRYAAYVGLEPRHYRSIIAIQGRNYQIVGINPSARKNNIEIERLPDGKKFVCSLKSISAQLGKLAAA